MVGWKWLGLILLLVGCVPHQAASPPLMPLPVSAETAVSPTCNLSNDGDEFMQYLALGDSYTIGESVPENERWPVQLVHRLRAAGLEMAEPHIIAKTGWTTAELAAGIVQSDLTGTFDLVSLLIGVNNQYRGRPLSEYREEFRVLLAQAIAFAGGDAGRVVVLSIPDWGVTPFASEMRRNTVQIATEIDAFNTVTREEAAARGVAYVDVTPISRQAVTDHTLLADDGLHPSGKMYAAWVDLALPLVSEILTDRGGDC